MVLDHVPYVPSTLSRVFEQYSKISLISVAEGLFGCFKGTVQLVRVFSGIFENILKIENIVILFYFIFYAEILVPGDVLEVLKMSFVKSLITVPLNSWSCGVPCGLFLVNF